MIRAEEIVDQDPAATGAGDGGTAGTPRRPARRGLVQIIGATGLGQLVALLAAPVLARLYPPEVYGPFAVLTALVLPLSVIAALRYEQAIPLPVRDSDARALGSLGLWLAATVGVVGVPVVVATSDLLVRLSRLDADVAPHLFWVPVVASLMGAFMVLNQMAIREKRYSAVARRNLFQAVVVTAAQVVAGAVGLGVTGLAAGLAIGQAAGVASLALSLRDTLRARPALNEVSVVARRFRRFPVVMAPSGLVNAVGLQVPVVIVSALYGVAAAGWLGMTQRVLLLPVSLVGLAVAQVFLGEFASARRSGRNDLEAMFLRTSARLAAVGVVGAGALLLLGPVAFGWVFGEDWARSGAYAQALAVALAAQLVASPLSQVLVVMERLGRQAAWDVARLVVVVASMLGAHVAWGSDRATVWALGMASTIAYGGAWLLCWSSLRSTVPSR